MAAGTFLVAALLLLFLPYDTQQDVAAALRSSILRPFVLAQEGLTEARARTVEVHQLRSRLDSMAAVVSSRTTLEEENRRLRGLLSLASRLGPSYVPATFLRPGTAGSESTFILDLGRDEGVESQAPVITRHGLVGVVREVEPTSSIGMDWTHPDFRASAMTADGTTFGMVESRRGDFREEDRLVLNGTAFHATLDQGTVVVTSGLGGVFPRGIPIGRVQGLADADAGWRKSYWLEPFAPPGSVTHALVATRQVTQGRAVATRDLSAAWPPDSVMTASELHLLSRRRRDSLAALGDSLRVLRSVVERLQSQDSIRRSLQADTTAPVRPRPPLPTGEGSGGGGEGSTSGSGGGG